MTDDLWENGLREVMSGTASGARVVAPPTDVILRKGRSSVRRRNGIAGSGVLGVVAAAVIAGTTLGAGSAGRPHPLPGAASTSARLAQAADAVVTVGPASAKTKVVLYEDYRCPVCKQFNTGISTTLQQDAAAGKIQVEYRPTDLIDRGFPGTGSVAAGNAVQCAADHGDFSAYRAALYAHQPASEKNEGFSSKDLIQLAHGIPGLDTPAFEKCVDDQPYATAIKHNYDTAINTLHCGGMPCLFVDGQPWPGEGVVGRGDLGTVVNSWLSQKIASA